jgi:hypothetical protein
MIELKDWSKPINIAKDLMNCYGTDPVWLSSTPSMSVGLNTELVLPSDPSPTAIILHNQLLGLSCAVSHSKASQFNNILAKMEYAASAFTTLSQGSWREVQDTTVLRQLMHR